MIYLHELMTSMGSNSSKQAARVFALGKKFSHMTADTEEELVAFAEKIGMRAAWLQDGGTHRFHFDVVASRFNHIMKMLPDEVKLVTKREFAALLHERRKVVVSE